MAAVRRRDLLHGGRQGRSVQPDRDLPLQRTRRDGDRPFLPGAPALAGDDEDQPPSGRVRGQHELAQGGLGLGQGQAVQVQPRLGEELAPAHRAVGPLVHRRGRGGGLHLQSGDRGARRGARRGLLPDTEGRRGVRGGRGGARRHRWGRRCGERRRPWRTAARNGARDTIPDGTVVLRQPPAAHAGPPAEVARRPATERSTGRTLKAGRPGPGRRPCGWAAA